MSRASPITRRRLGHLLASLVATIVSRAKGEEPETPTQIEHPPRNAKEKGLRDRGIGGTGVIGTIRGFGSIVVNNLHVSYPDDVPVFIDGQRAKVSSLRLGQIVQVLAHGHRDRLVASHIEVTSEVVGPVQSVNGSEMLVLGQRIQIASSLREANIRAGDVVAVFGLRRLDGMIVASRIEHRPGARFSVAGPLMIDATGQQQIGGLLIKGSNPEWKGTRVIAKGHLAANMFHLDSSRQDLLLLADPRLSRIILESYVENSSSRIMFGFGFQLPAARTRINPRELEGAAVVATFGRIAGGGLELHGASIDGTRPSPPSSPLKAPPPQMPGNLPGLNMPNGTNGPGGSPPSGGPPNSGGPPSNH
ncbi:DUF5666 domain-containing protein [Labrys okinawensis]|uniref:DUF5666 domain-containing protein n=1 Tax=Labrys okinawensis TaxID=346911 RepID=UPI0039BD4362